MLPFAFIYILCFQFGAKQSCRKFEVIKVKFKVKYAVRNLEVNNHKLSKTTNISKCLKHVTSGHAKDYFSSSE